MDIKPFVLLNTGSQEYKLKFSSGAMAQTEQRLGSGFFRSLEKMDSVDIQLNVLWAALQKFNHGIKFADVPDIYDEYLENGGSLEDLMQLLLETFEISGFLSRDKMGKQPKKKTVKK